MAKSFIFDTNPKIGDETLSLDGTTYKLKVGTDNYTFHIIPRDAAPESVDFTRQDLKALYYLLTTNKP